MKNLMSLAISCMVATTAVPARAQVADDMSKSATVTFKPIKYSGDNIIGWKITGLGYDKGNNICSSQTKGVKLVTYTGGNVEVLCGDNSQPNAGQGGSLPVRARMCGMSLTVKNAGTANLGLSYIVKCEGDSSQNAVASRLPENPQASLGLSRFGFEGAVKAPKFN